MFFKDKTMELHVLKWKIPWNTLVDPNNTSGTHGWNIGVICGDA